MGKIPPHVFISFDACGLGPPVETEKRAVEKILALIDEHELQCDIPEDVADEVDRHERARQLRKGRLVSCNPSIGEKWSLDIHRLLFGEKDDLLQNETNDIRILLNAYHYLCSYFVTYDKTHILSKRDEIKSKLGFDVVTPTECLAVLQRYLE